MNYFRPQANTFLLYFNTLFSAAIMPLIFKLISYLTGIQYTTSYIMTLSLLFAFFNFWNMRRTTATPFDGSMILFWGILLALFNAIGHFFYNGAIVYLPGLIGGIALFFAIDFVIQKIRNRTRS